jgi:hypothetical protein
VARSIFGPDVSFYQDDPGTPQEINFERMNLTTDFVIVRAGQNLWADLLLSVYTGMALDGGGSSTLVIEGVDRLPRLLNTPVNESTPKRERAVANHLGISLKKQ